MSKGLLISISGPSGSGKGSVLAKVKERNSAFGTSISVTTRAPRDGETDGTDYYFRSREEFVRMVEEGEIIEYDEFVGNLYGTPTIPLQEMSEAGTDVLLDLTIAGSMALKENFEQAVTIFLIPPSYEELEKRLRGRGTESDEDVKARLEVARDEIDRSGGFDYVVVNDDLDEAAAKIEAIIKAEKCRLVRNIEKLREMT
ncbi:MAG: guanylate kinase [Clostridiales bacterium]|nr:guanylate kinase [Clostridiales bacterium]